MVWEALLSRTLPCFPMRRGASGAAGNPRPVQPPATGTQTPFSCAGAGSAMESEAGGTGEETDLPLPSHGTGPQGKSRGGGPGNHGRFWALVPGVVVRILPASRADIPPCGGFLWAMTCFLPFFQVDSAPATLPSPLGCAGRADSSSAVQDGTRDRDGCASMGDPSAHGSHQAGVGMDAGAPPSRAL